MKNKYINFSMLLVGVGINALPHPSAAQLLTRAHTRPDIMAYGQQAPPETRQQPRALKKALAEVEKRFNVSFAYDAGVMTGRQSEVRLEGLSLDQSLAQLIGTQGLRYRRVTDNLYVIQDSSPKTLQAGGAPPASGATTGLPNESAAATAGASQARRLTGQITDETDKGLPGANVIEKGTNNGTTTDANGNFVLNVSDAATTLTISSVGYISQEIAIGTRLTVNVKLAPDNRTLDEVVVVSYGTQKRSNLTEAVGIVNVAEARKVQAPSVVDQIQGRVSGVTVASAGGAPGATASIKIRGSSTFGSNQDPIYIIDGVIIGSASSDFNPNDIESITVLKDAAATALYGSRGMNGAIVITTRRGKAGKPTIEYNGYYGVQDIAKRLPLAGREQYIRTWTAAYTNAGLPVPDFGSGGFNTDWQDELIKSGAITDHNLSISGGTDNGDNKSNYRISGGYFDQQGTIVGPYFKRYSGRINAGVTRGKLNIGESLYLAQTNERRVIGQPFDQVIRMPPTVPVYNTNNLSGYGFGSVNNPTFGTNPIGQQLKDDNTVNSYKLLGNVFAEYAILPWLSYRLSVGLDFNLYQNKYFARPGALSYNSPDTPFGILDDRNGRFFNTLLENTLNVNKTFGKHQLSGLVGYTRQRFDQNETLAHTEGIDGNFTQQNAGTSNPRTEGFSFISGIVSYLGRVNYNFADKYNVQVNIRRDASSNFPKNNQVAYFPSISAGWNINREPFMQGISAIGDLRLRASYGSVGNQDIAPYSLDPTIQPNLNYVLGGGNVIVPGASNRQLQNSNLRWESKTTADVGVDASFFNGKLQLTADYFNSLANNLLLRVPLPITAGNQGANPFDNIGQIRNRGVELSLTYQDKRGPWRYSLNGQITSIRNKVLQLVPTNGNQPIFGYGQITRTAVGGGLAEFYVLKQNGIFQNQGEIDAGPKQPNVTPGDVRYVDANGDGQINNDDRQVVGTPFPTLEYGSNIAVSYKNFDLTVFFQGVAGNVLFNRSRNWTDRFDDVQNVRSDVTFWTGPGSSTTTPKPIREDKTLNPAFNTDRWVESGAYGRLRTLQLAYNFPSTMLSRWRMSTARVYVNAQNLVTITKYSGYNPDVIGDVGAGSQNSSNFIGRGIDQGNYPVPRTISVGVQVGF
ncbi:MAG TPA: SusC/RagA family TonB-linked outer membrane protein [Spirosoma sp.]|nr:SusC/RagA family TonB-linked outer membrane protein [Spirosoma sp.]